ncbi:MAG TPA: PAC2 family protein [Syntrophobacteria bacterium]|nr:PAC2 family protein [Syntrophobacteria bacterium]
MALSARIRQVAQTELRDPILLAAWPGMGHVALKAFMFLQESLSARNLAVLEGPDFFQLPGAFLRDGLIQSSQLPQSGFFFWQRDHGPGDIIFFIGDRQPVSGKELALAEAVLEFAQRHGASRVATVAAMPASINHYQPSRVWVTATHGEILREVSPFCHRVLDEGHISGMNGLLLGVAKRRAMRGFCLLGEIPSYTTTIENPKASMAVIEVLTKVLELQVDLTGLRELALQAEKEIDRYLLELQMREQDEEKEKKTTGGEGPATVH